MLFCRGIVTKASRTFTVSTRFGASNVLTCQYTPVFRRRISQAANDQGTADSALRQDSSFVQVNDASDNVLEATQSPRDNTHLPTLIESFKQTLHIPQATCSFQTLAESGPDMIGKQVILHGYLGTRRPGSRSLQFAEVHNAGLNYTAQIVSSASDFTGNGDSPHQVLADLPDHSPVTVHGTVKARHAPKKSSGVADDRSERIVTDIEIKLENLVPLNTFPTDIIMKSETVFPAQKRHLQIRNGREIREALAFRSRAAGIIRSELCTTQNFVEIETPLLFKSTPEGAREFLVPCRSPGMAYALPQSPQQYKQILMGSGIPRYMQIAKCFRDEDLRADRQPEFTQVDLEMAFASGEDVMRVVEDLIRRLWAECLGINDMPEVFPRLTYEEAMSRYGSDKPDLRFGSEIRKIGHLLPVDLISKIGPLTDPIVEVIKISLDYNAKSARQTADFIGSFMDSKEARPFIENSDGQPGIFVVDGRKPLQGLQAFGFEAAEQLEEMLELEDGDLVVLQARKDIPFSGGSTPLGKFRTVLHKAAVEKGLINPSEGFEFTWVTDFPLFSPSVANEPGQGGAAGLASTHHPFTAPKTAEDVDLLLTDPTKAKADHYDLVVNGVELGGGSRRIHNAQMQSFVMSDVLKMSQDAMSNFDHLLEVLRSGCPPHAGIALGFDRLIAVMMGKESVRDVIAFPKSGRGEDLLVKSPSEMTKDQLRTYQLSVSRT